MPRLVTVFVFASAVLVPTTIAGHEDLVRKAKDTTKNIDFVACPVLAGLYRRGILVPDEGGKVTASQLEAGLKATGVSEAFAKFQSIGISGYRADDPHQNVRRSNGPDAFFRTLYLNIFSMNPADDCQVVGDSANSGVPCNANPQYQQHGYSTTMRDTRFDAEDPTRQKRFNFWIGSELVDPASAGLQLVTSERVMFFDGLARMLAKARSGKGDKPMFTGDFSGEYSLTSDGKWEGSGIQKWHPSVTTQQKYKTLAAWQPLLAWAGWWVAFARKDGDTTYFTESDLEGFFIRGEYPKDWQPTSWETWGLDPTFHAILAFDDGKSGDVGQDWIDAVRKMMLPEDAYYAEYRYNAQILAELVSLGITTDSIHNTWPPSDQATSPDVVV